MATTFEFMPPPGFDPDAFAANLGFTVDYSDTVYDDHGRLYRLTVVETLTAAQKIDVLSRLFDRVSPDVPGGGFGRGTRETPWAIGPYLWLDATNLTALAKRGGLLYVVEDGKLQVQKPVVHRKHGWLLNERGIHITKGRDT